MQRQGERGDHHDGDDATPRLPVPYAISKRPGSSASGERVMRGATKFDPA
jgi:hypothetical protein